MSGARFQVSSARCQVSGARCEVNRYQGVIAYCDGTTSRFAECAAGTMVLYATETMSMSYQEQQRLQQFTSSISSWPLGIGSGLFFSGNCCTCQHGQGLKPLAQQRSLLKQATRGLLFCFAAGTTSRRNRDDMQRRNRDSSCGFSLERTASRISFVKNQCVLVGREIPNIK